jgi:hypothetical protein
VFEKGACPKKRRLDGGGRDGDVLRPVQGTAIAAGGNADADRGGNADAEKDPTGSTNIHVLGLFDTSRLAGRKRTYIASKGIAGKGR